MPKNIYILLKLHTPSFCNFDSTQFLDIYFGFGFSNLSIFLITTMDYFSYETFFLHLITKQAPKQKNMMI